MIQNSNPLIDSLNLFIFLILLKQKSQSIFINDHDLHNNVEDINKNSNQNKKLQKQNDIKKELKKHTFWEELYIHAKKVNYVKIKVMADGPGSTITGYLVKLHKDFITLVKKGEKINIPINKILTLKLEKSNKSNKNVKQEENTVNDNNLENNKIIIKKFQQLQLPFNKIMSLPKRASELLK